MNLTVAGSRMTKKSENAETPRSGNRAQRHSKQRNSCRVHCTLPRYVGLYTIFVCFIRDCALINTNCGTRHLYRPNLYFAIDILGGWVNSHREQQTIPQGQTSIPPKSFPTPTANGQSAPRSGSARGVGRGAGSHTPSTASES